MARTTIANTIISDMTAKGYSYVGMTSGWYSFRKGSNLRHFLDSHQLAKEEVEVEIGAKCQRASEGTQLLVFRVPTNS